ncbi:hypothetical protein AMTRI_Chr06g198560 [Amborella trichopoda]
MEWVNYLAGRQYRIEKNFARWDEFLETVIADHFLSSHGEAKEEEDFVDVLLQLQREETPDFTLTRDQIKSLVLDTFAGATESASATLEWGMSELMKNPEVMRNAQTEVRRITKSSGKTMIEERDLQHLDYLKRVVKEILRVHPPAPLLLPHESIEDCDLDGYRIPSGTRVFLNAWAIGSTPTLGTTQKHSSLTGLQRVALISGDSISSLFHSRQVEGVVLDSHLEWLL